MTERCTLKLKSPNPLFAKWIEEWRDETESTFLKENFNKALESLNKFPLVLESGRDCLILEHFDTQLCVKLDRKLAEHNAISRIPVNLNYESQGQKRKSEEALEVIHEDVEFYQDLNFSACEFSTLNSESAQENIGVEAGDKNVIELSDSEAGEAPEPEESSPPEDLEPESPQPKKPRKKAPGTKKTKTSSPGKPEATSKEKKGKSKKEYIPGPRTGGYAILVALYSQEQNDPNYPGHMRKDDLIKTAQPLCKTSFTKTFPGSCYNAWSIMSHLVTKALVVRQGNPPKYSLTEGGRELAKKLKDIDAEEEAAYGGSSSSSSSGLSNQVAKEKSSNPPDLEDEDSQATTTTEEPTQILLPHSFDVLLLVDTAETIGQFQDTEQRLNELKVKFEVRHLKVGDYLWIARHKETGIEVVLPYIVERKRTDDLASSIKDGRFQEQKFRLKQCGLPNLIYLVEKWGDAFYGLAPGAVNQAIINTMVVDGFTVKNTGSHYDSMVYLASITAVLTDLFKGKSIFTCNRDELAVNYNTEDDFVSLCTFKHFMHAIGKNKNFRVKEMFVKQLVQLYGLSADKAWAIVQQYPTPSSLIEAFLSQGEHLLDNTKYGSLQRKIGHALSKTLYHFYTSHQFK